MLINDSGSSGGGMASMLASSGLGGLASLAGVSVSAGATFSELAIYLIGSNALLDAVVDEFGLLERYKIKKYFSNSRLPREREMGPLRIDRFI
jgi:hypothetical protein